MRQDKIKVIIVDDDLVLGTSLKLGLKAMGMAPYYIDTLNGLVEKIKEVQPNILVLDIEIGDDNGLDEIKELESQDIHIPILIMSSHIEMSYISKALQENACHFMKKPFEIEELALYIQRFAKTEDNTLPTKIKIGSSELDTVSHFITILGTNSIHLSLKQYQVMVLLTEHMGKMVTRQELKEALWPDGNASDASLDNYISQLRKLLAPDTSVSIDTIPKTGFMLRLC